MITEPDLSLPEASASSIIALAILSFTEPAGLKYSSLAKIFASSPCAFSIFVSSSNGVLPISSSADLYILDMIFSPLLSLIIYFVSGDCG
ncbi:hypothetical protein SDC9_175087 [bioreactor metagenome]|uniref:Uncharacterized protein n=1 Tax=bioreactor metagenome TaxID=1076179 RepID=A0A645GVJ0_9ZZZZ